MENRINIGEIIKALRNQKGYTLRELANQSGVSFSQLSKIERSENHPTKETIEAIATCLDFNAETLLLLAGYVSDQFQQTFRDELYTIFTNVKNTYAEDDFYIKTKSILLKENSHHYFEKTTDFFKDYVSDSVKDTVKSKIFKLVLETIENQQAEKKYDRANAWNLFIEDMEQQGKTPEDLYKMMQTHEKRNVALEQMKEMLANMKIE